MGISKLQKKWAVWIEIEPYKLRVYSEQKAYSEIWSLWLEEKLKNNENTIWVFIFQINGQARNVSFFKTISSCRSFFISEDIAYFSRKEIDIQYPLFLRENQSKISERV